jgi:arsenite/tail-anchored protein-transporting ATPase
VSILSTTMTDLEPTLSNIVNQRSLSWIFVGGKGGVGKTTTSCCLSIQLAKTRRNVLIVSTDPAHNLSDAFGQKFESTPKKVNGFDNLFCMEVDSSSTKWDDMEGVVGPETFNALEGGLGGIMKDLMKSVPGIDEAMAFGELMKMVTVNQFSFQCSSEIPLGSRNEL